MYFGTLKLYNASMLKTCMFCNNKFETSYYLPDGHRVRCDKRTKCWDCLPRDRKRLVRGVESGTHSGETIVCGRCSKSYKYFDIGSENKYCHFCRIELRCSKCYLCNSTYVIKALQRNTGFLSLCNLCIKENKKALTKFKCVEYLGGCCKQCGWKDCLWGLEFHHRDEIKKSFTINEHYCSSWNKLKGELDKCDLLCANCHRLAHYNSSTELHKYLSLTTASFSDKGIFSENAVV